MKTSLLPVIGFCSVSTGCVSRITTSLAHKRPFHWISMKSRLVRGARETSKFQNWSHLSNSRRRYIVEIVPIRRKTLSNQNQSINQSKPTGCRQGSLIIVPNLWSFRRSDLYRATPAVTRGLGFCGLIRETTPPQFILLEWKTKNNEWLYVFVPGSLCAYAM